MILCTTISSHAAYSDSSFTGKVVSVADGDTITVLTADKQQIKVRLSSVDTPEGGQAYGQKAKNFTSSMVFKKNVTIHPETTDKYGRTVAMVYVDGKNLNEQIVANGYGWVYRYYCKGSYCDDWLKLEETARDAQIGLWADNHPLPPWDWRQQQRNGNAGSSAVGGVNKLPVAGNSSGPFHGNIKSQVFHGPGCQHYNCKNCTMRFNSVSEAISAGYRGHRECVK